MRLPLHMQRLGLGDRERERGARLSDRLRPVELQLAKRRPVQPLLDRDS